MHSQSDVYTYTVNSEFRENFILVDNIKRHICDVKNSQLVYDSPTSVRRVQWLSGRVLDSKPKGRGSEPHRWHCVVSLSKTNLFLLSTGSTQEDPSRDN